MIGEKGMIFSPDDGDQDLRTLVKLKGDKELVRLQNHERPKRFRRRSRATNSEARPTSASTGNGSRRARMENTMSPYSNFDIAAYLTEIILLGCVGLRVGKKLEWDGPAMMAKNAPEAAAVVKRQYRQGWQI